MRTNTHIKNKVCFSAASKNQRKIHSFANFQLFLFGGGGLKENETNLKNKQKNHTHTPKKEEKKEE